MESYLGILSNGGKANSLGRASEVVTDVLAHPEKLRELFDCISADDAWVRMRAIDSFEKIIRDHPSWAEHYSAEMFSDLVHRDQASIQWHVAQLFTEIRLDTAQQTEAIEWLKQKLTTTDVDWIVAVDCMKALIVFHARGLVELPDLKRYIAIQLKHKSPAVRKKAGKLVTEIGEISS